MCHLQGVGLGFGGDVTRRFLEDNKVSGVIRSHEVRQGGYSVEHGGQCITVFSAPNYVSQTLNCITKHHRITYLIRLQISSGRPGRESRWRSPHR